MMNKFPLYFAIVWSMIVAFGLVSVVAKHPLGVQVIVMVACAWTISRILLEAILAYKILMSEDEPKDDPPKE